MTASGPTTDVHTFDGGTAMEDPILLSAEECITLIEKESGTVIALRTFHAYAHRGQAPKPVDRKGRTPLWDKAEMVNWIHNRPGRGNRSRAWKIEKQ